MRFEHLHKYLSATEIRECSELGKKGDDLWAKALRLEKQALALKQEANLAFEEQTALLADAQAQNNNEKFRTDRKEKTENRKAWKKYHCSKDLPPSCRCLAKCSIEHYRGDCPRGMSDPAETDADEVVCENAHCKFLGSEIIGYEDINGIGCEIYDAPVRKYFCQRQKYFLKTAEQVACFKDDCLKNCHLCYDYPDRRRFGD